MPHQISAAVSDRSFIAMETSSSAVLNQLFPSLGPTLMISMGYIDLGKCFAAVEGGARFGHDLVLLVLIFNLTAILCQYLAVRVGIVTGKDLAQVIHVCLSFHPDYFLSADSFFTDNAAT